VSLFVDALSDAGTQMTATLTSVARAFEAGWQTGLATLLASPAALFYVAAFATMVVLVMGGLRRAGSAGYQRGRFLTANEKSFLMTLDAALGQNYAHPVIMRSRPRQRPANHLHSLTVPSWGSCA
jgi:hypothetical protein